jgi:hypothetical protein
MTEEQLEAMFERVRAWPSSKQEDAVQLLLAFESHGQEPYLHSPDEGADAKADLAALEAGEVAPGADVDAVRPFAERRLTDPTDAC